MKILLICHEYPPLGGGGGRQLSNLARMYAKDHAVYVLTVGFRESGVCQRDGYTLHRLPARRKHQAKPSHLEFLSFLIEAWKAIPAVVRTFRPDVVQVFFSIPEGFLLFHPKLRHIPGIISVRGADVPGHDPNRFPILYKLIRPIVKIIWNHARQVVCNSDDLRREVVAISPTLPVDVIPNGIDCERFTPSSPPRASHELTLLYVGRLIPLKRIDLVIQAIAKLRVQGHQVHFRIVGSGSHQQVLRDLVAHCGLVEQVTFTGNVAYEDIQTVYQQADIYVQLSTVEGMSNSILEALASGLPIISSNVGGASALIDANGALIEQPTLETVVQSITTYVESPSLLREHGQQSRKIAETYCIEQIAQQYTTLLATCLTGANL